MMKFKFGNWYYTVFNKALPISLYLLIGFLLAMSLLPAFVGQSNFKDIWGNILGGFIGLIAAFLVVRLQTNYERNAEKEKRTREEIMFFNHLRRVLLQKFMDAKVLRGREDETPRIPSSGFDLASLDHLRKKAFEILNPKTSDIAEQVYVGYFDLNNSIVNYNKEGQPNFASQARALVSKNEEVQIFIKALNDILSFESEFNEATSDFMKERNLKFTNYNGRETISPS